MSLTPRQIEALARWADRWLDADPDTRAALRAQAANEGDAVLRAFDAMVNALAADAPTHATGAGAASSAVLPPPITPTMRAEALVSAAERAADDGYRAAHTGQAESHMASAREAGQRIGPYRLIRELGRGGMGAVWLAERADGQHTRQVALKVPLVENLNWLLAARFARERSILASLEHPGIARLYDAGVDKETQPYIAIEYVSGVAIGDYVRAHKLRPDAVVALFIRVIDAVAYAHTQLVLHRDIKPSNILVDDKGNPHLLDFGIAKLLDDEDTAAVDATQLTRLSGRALTLDYASPEQVNNLAIGTASDIYSLGVLLFELLTGSRPYHPKGPSRRDLEQAILDQDAPRPSEHLLITAQQTGDSEGSKTARRLRGDLDTIVLTALRKDPKQRYATAQAFADDLRRYLAVEPILARPQGPLYRVGKFVRRHRWALAGSAVAALAVATVGGYALLQQREAEASAGRAQAVDSLLHHLFRGMSPDFAATRTFTAGELLDRTAQFIDADPLLNEATRRSAGRTMAELYHQIGDYDKAIKRYEQERSDAQHSGDVQREARALGGLIDAHTTAMHPEQAELLLVQLTDLLRRYRIDGGPLAASVPYLRGRLAYYQQQYAAALPLFAAAAAQARALGNAGRTLLADSLRMAGDTYIMAGDIALAGQPYREALALNRALGDSRALETLYVTGELAEADIRMGRYADGLAQLRPMRDELERRLGRDHPMTLNALQTLSTALLRTGNFEEGRAASQQLRQATSHPTVEQIFSDEMHAGLTAMYSGDLASAERRFRDLLATLPSTASRSRKALLMAQHAEVMLREHRLDDATRIMRDVERALQDEPGSKGYWRSYADVLRICLYARRGEFATARAIADQVSRSVQRERSESHPLWLVSAAYRELLASESGADATDSKRSQLAARLRAELGWQRSASELADWVERAARTRDWSKLPVVS